MADPIENPKPDRAPHRGSLQLASRERTTLGAALRDAARRSPYLVIAVALNLSLIAAATVWKLSEDERVADGGPLVARVTAVEEKPAEEPAPPKDLFEERDSILSPDAEEATDDEPQLIPLDPSFLPSDHDETDSDRDFGNAEGSSEDSPLLGAKGVGLLDSMGVGFNSARGGRAGRGTPDGGGNRNLYRVRRTPRSKASATENAVDAGLRWLARHQSPDGSWSAEGFAQRCGGGAVCEGKGFPEHQVGLTALACLAFLGAGHDERSTLRWKDPFTGRELRAGHAVREGLKWLRANQDESGSFASTANGKWGYNHSLATLAMAEGYGLSRGLAWRESAQKGVDALIAGQNAAPGSTGLLAWRYRPRDGENDISVTGWAVMALKSAELAGLRTARGSMEGALAFCDEVTDKASGKVGYTRREEAGQQVKAPGRNDDYLNHPALAAVGMCVRAFTSHDLNDPMLEAGAKLLVQDLPVWSKAKKSNDYYYWYYGSLALNQFDGPDSPRANRGLYWNPWNQAMTKALIETQTRDPKLCLDGSWDADDRWGFEGGRVYATAINSLTFEVYYRYANAFGRKAQPSSKK